jgi:hypothetical protein
MLNELAKECYDIAMSKGWHTAEICFGNTISNIHCELSEAFEDYRCGKPLNIMYFEEDGKPTGIPSEFADIIIRVMDACANYGIDIDTAVAVKMEYNKTRSLRHGGKVV